MVAIRPERPKRLGILFVHGMGEQERGDTITQMGDALTEWLRRWIKVDPTKDLVIREATLRDTPQATAPATDLPNDTAAQRVTGPAAHATVEIIDKADPARNQQWLLAESWWADAFRQATFGELVVWAISVGPWLIASQRQGVVRRVWEADPPFAIGIIGQAILWVLKLATTIGLYLIAVVIAGVITPLAIVLLLVGLLPIPVLSGFARAIAHNLAGSFGDLLVLVRSPIRFAAMAERVRRDLVVMGEECETVMVVAHSQGSAVAWHALRRMAQQDETLPKVGIFVTFGQALRKLKSLYRVQEQGGARQGRATLLALVSTLLLIGEAWLVGIQVYEQLHRGGDLMAISIPGTALLAIFGGALLIVMIQEMLDAIVRDTTKQTESELGEEFAEVQARFAGISWVDLWASADPASNGPLMQALPPGIFSYKLRNLASTVFDHSDYWSNVTEFVSTVAFTGASLVPTNALGATGRLPAQLIEAARTRDRRVSMLAAARVAYCTAVAVGLYGVRGFLPNWGDAILAWAQTLPLVPDWTSWPGFWKGALALGLVALAGVAGWFALVWSWSLAIRADEQQFFARRPGLPNTLARVWFGAALAVPTAAIIALWQLFAGVDGPLVLWYLGIGALLVAIVWWILQAGGQPLGPPDPEPDGEGP